MLTDTPSLKRRFACMVYEALVLLALWIVAAFPFVGLSRGLDPGLARPLLQAYMLVVAGLYFVWFWRHGGQTLPMKTWRIRLLAADGGPVGLRQAWLRYALAWLGLAAFGLGVLWALLDPERQFLHDRLAGTRLRRAE